MSAKRLGLRHLQALFATAEQVLCPLLRFRATAKEVLCPLLRCPHLRGAAAKEVLCPPFSKKCSVPLVRFSALSPFFALVLCPPASPLSPFFAVVDQPNDQQTDPGQTKFTTESRRSPRHDPRTTITYSVFSVPER